MIPIISRISSSNVLHLTNLFTRLCLDIKYIISSHLYQALFLFFKHRDGSRRRGDGREMLPSGSRLGFTNLGSSQDIGASNGDLYYNSRPAEGHWYQPPPPVITHQPKPSSTQHFQPYERGYPKTLESLAEKVSSSQFFGCADMEIMTRIEIH